MTGYDGECVVNCGDYFYPDTSQSQPICVDCSLIHDNCLKCQDDGTCLVCTNTTDLNGDLVVGYLTGGTCVTNPANCPAGTTVGTAQLNLCEPCDSICLTCEVTPDKCTSCDGLILYNDTCGECPDDLVEKDGVCVSCSTDCLTCSITFDNCTSCDTTGSKPYLYENKCLNVCPDFYYEDIALGECRLCADLVNLHCDQCATSTTCSYGGCNTPYVFNPDDSKCYDPTPTGYVNISGIAQKCDIGSDCATC